MENANTDVGPSGEHKGWETGELQRNPTPRLDNSRIHTADVDLCCLVVRCWNDHGKLIALLDRLSTTNPIDPHNGAVQGRNNRACANPTGSIGQSNINFLNGDRRRIDRSQFFGTQSFYILQCCQNSGGSTDRISKSFLQIQLSGLVLSTAEQFILAEQRICPLKSDSSR